jgi:hypothetical protein
MKAGATVAEAWERQNGESVQAYAAFQAFRDAGPDRSLKAAALAVGKSIQMIKQWSGPKNWLSRAAAYDAHLEQVRLQERDRREKRRAALWQRRRSILTECEYRLSRRLFAEVERAIEGHEEPAIGDKPTAKVPPSATELRRLASVVAQASAVARKAVEAETQERMEPNPTQEGPLNPSPILVHVEPLAEPDVVRQAREELMAWQSEVGDQLAGAAGPRPAPPGSMPPVGQGL